MKRPTKIILLGLLVWVIPFLVSFFVWDVESNSPILPDNWFNSLMILSLSIGIAISSYVYFKDKIKNPCREGWIIGSSWYSICIIIDLIFLVGIFNMTLSNFYPMFLSYTVVLIIPGAIGEILNQREK